MSTAPVTQPPLSEATRVINTFVSPATTFADIRRNQSWWVPWLLLCVMAMGYFALVGQKVGYEQIARNEIQKSSRYEQFEKLPAEQRERQVQLSANITKYFGFAAPATTLIVYLIVAGILMATFNFGAGAEVTYKQALAISFYASLPMILFYALAMLSLIIGVDAEGFNIRNVAATNPAYFMDPAHNKFLYGLASGLDVFAIWSIILTGIGYASLSKLKRSSAILIVASWYVVYKLAGAALSLLG
jgi:Yip1 domain